MFSLNLIILLVNSYLVTLSCAQSEYCNLQSCQGNPHTLCTYPSDSVSSSCGQCYKVGLTQDEKNTITNLHNKLRQKVASGDEKRGSNGAQPAAARGAMKNFGWNDEMAYIAQRWANQCLGGHDQCRNMLRDTRSQGQNVATEWNSDPNGLSITNLIYAWYNEVVQFNKDLVYRYQFDPPTGHYSQMVWGDTESIGCGYIRCLERENWYVATLVCNYAPAGNVISWPIYRT